MAGSSGSLGLEAEMDEGPGLAPILLTLDTQHRLKIHHLLFWRRKPSSPRIVNNYPPVPLTQPPL